MLANISTIQVTNRLNKIRRVIQRYWLRSASHTY